MKIQGLLVALVVVLSGCSHVRPLPPTIPAATRDATQMVDNYHLAPATSMATAKLNLQKYRGTYWDVAMGRRTNDFNLGDAMTLGTVGAVLGLAMGKPDLIRVSAVGGGTAAIINTRYPLAKQEAAYTKAVHALRCVETTVAPITDELIGGVKLAAPHDAVAATAVTQTQAATDHIVFDLFESIQAMRPETMDHAAITSAYSQFIVQKQGQTPTVTPPVDPSSGQQMRSFTFSGKSIDLDSAEVKAYVEAIKTLASSLNVCVAKGKPGT